MADRVPDALWAAECREDMAVERMEREAKGRTCGECEHFCDDLLCPCGCGWAPCDEAQEMVNMGDVRCDAEIFRLRRGKEDR